MKKNVYKILLTIDEFIDSYEGAVGCVYPSDGDSYYIGSNLGPNLRPISLIDGMLFAEHTMDELTEAGYPNKSFWYDDKAYQKAVEAYNATAGMDNRPHIPTPGGFAIEDAEEILSALEIEE